MTDPLFAGPSDLAEEKRYGNRYNGRYHMPLLPGESGTKSCPTWVPKGSMSMTNLVGAVEDTRALSVWEQVMGLIGLALSPELYEELTFMVQQAIRDGVDFQHLRDHPAFKEALAGTAHDQAKQEASLMGRAKFAAGAHRAAVKGTNRHTAWEHRGAGQDYIGTPDIVEHTKTTEQLLADAGLIRIGLSERVVRNLKLGTSGRFDDILMEQGTGRLLISDLKTKSTKFYSWTTVDAQMAGYARAEWMLTEDCQGYEPGPLHHVDQTEGVILHVPSDGSPARLERADLIEGWQNCLLAKRIVERRSAGKSADRMNRSLWVSAGQS